MPEAEEKCLVCEETLDLDNRACCSVCGRYFHLSWSIHGSVKNCGRPWFREDACSMGFVCRRCDEARLSSASSAEPPSRPG